MYDIEALGRRAKAAARLMAAASSQQKDAALAAIAAALPASAGEILAANALDLEHAAGRISPVMLDRLRLTEARIDGVAAAIGKVIALPDPVGELILGSTRPNGLQIRQLRVPMGVIAIIFESRPNVTVDAAVLSLKAGNACILRGGSEAIRSNTALVAAMRGALESVGLPADAVQLVEDTDHATANALMGLREYVDLLIPRGSARLINAVTQNAKVPVIETGAGNCHLFVDESADLEMAVRIADNAKTQRPSVCNALETLLVHRAVAQRFLPLVKTALDAHQVELRGCEDTRRILGDCVTPATELDYETEFNDYILAVRVVDDLTAALEHIERYSTRHSEAIVTESYQNAQRFLAEVDSACLYVNASPRFTDGEEFGLGAEVGISTQKMHARGPMGLTALTTSKYQVYGSGQIR